MEDLEVVAVAAASVTEEAEVAFLEEEGGEVMATLVADGKEWRHNFFDS